ncbi:MAG: sulfatase-like hydrolase/transferase [Promethearchaeota archaeon]
MKNNINSKLNNKVSILFFIMLISLIMGCLESAIAFIATNDISISRVFWNYKHLLTMISISTFVWLPILLLFSFILYFISKLNFLMKLIINFGSFIILASLFIINISSWKFYFRNGIFLIQNAIVFTFLNFKLLIFHFIQTSPKTISILVAFSIFLALIIVFLLNVIIKIRDKFKYKKILIAVYGSLIIILTLNFHIEKKNFHPFLSILASGSIYESVDEQTMLKVLTLKDNANSFTIDEQNAKPVIVIMIESMRKDLIDMQPCPIPFMKQLAEKSLFFDKSYITSSHSNYSDLSIWYSRYPLRANYREPYSEESVSRGLSIFEYFNKIGYHTGYISSQNEKWGDMINWLKGKGIDYFYHSENYDKETWFNEDDRGGLSQLIKNKKATAGKIEDSATIKIAEDWISGLDHEIPFFLGMNLQNTHFDYVVSTNSIQPFEPSVIDFPMVYYDWPESKVVHVRNRYLNAFHNLDSIIKDFVSYLKKEGLWDNCYFVIIGDSGEAFYEHGFANHSGSMYDEIARTFTMIKPPKGVDVQMVEKSISHIDIFPTLLDIMGIPIPGSFQGYSAYDSDKQRKIFMHNNSFVWQDALVSWPWKMLITYHPVKKVELYNLVTDPMEKQNQIDEYPDIVNEMKQQIKIIHDSQIEYYKNPNFFIKYNPPNIY